MARTLYGLSDGSLVNFIFRMTGLKKFAEEYAHSHKLLWNHFKIHVLPLERIFKSKHDSGREKDIAHLPLLKRVMRGQQLASTPGAAKKNKRRQSK